MIYELGRDSRILEILLDLPRVFLVVRLRGPLRERLRGKAVALIVCGSNIDAASYAKLVAP